MMLRENRETIRKLTANYLPMRDDQNNIIEIHISL